MTKQQKDEQAKAIAKLRDLLPPGSTVWTETVHCSRSGMQRLMRVFGPSIEGGAPNNITWDVAKALGEKPFNRPGFGYWVIKQNGCGMDMGFALVYALSYRLYPQGFAVEGVGRNGDTSGHDDDGGYALKQRWL